MSIITKSDRGNTDITEVVANSKRVDIVKANGTVVWERPNYLHIRITNYSITDIWFDYQSPEGYATGFTIYATKLRTIEDGDGLGNIGCVGFDTNISRAYVNSSMTKSELLTEVRKLNTDRTSLFFCMNSNREGPRYWKTDFYQIKYDGAWIYPKCFRISDATTVIQGCEPIPASIFTKYSQEWFHWEWYVYFDISTYRESHKLKGDTDAHFIVDRNKIPGSYTSGDIVGACKGDDYGMDLPTSGGPVYKVTYSYEQAGRASYTFNVKSFNKEIL